MQSVWIPDDQATQSILAPTSKTAGIVNAYNAFVLANELYKKKNKIRKDENKKIIKQFEERILNKIKASIKRE